MVVYNLQDFLELSEQDLARVQTLYLAEADLGLQRSKVAFANFLYRLSRCVQLVTLNLRHNYLNDAQLIRIADALQHSPVNPKVINLRFNGECSPTVIQEFARDKRTLLADNYADNAKILQLPQGWQFKKNLKVYEVEIYEIFKVVTALRVRFPHVTKFHSVGKPFVCKNIVPDNTDMHSTLLLPVVIMADGSVMIVPSFNAPEKLRNSNVDEQKVENSRAKGQRNKLGITSTPKGFQFTFGKVARAFAPGYFVAAETYLRSTLQPLWQAQRSKKRYESTSGGYQHEIVKQYLFTPFYGEADVLDYTQELEADMEGLLITPEYLRLAVAMMLELMCVHNAGWLSLDFKPENLILRDGPDELTAVDSTHRQQISAVKPLYTKEGIREYVSTWKYLPPEFRAVIVEPQVIEQNPNLYRYSQAMDYYACGASIVSILCQDDYSDEPQLPDIWERFQKNADKIVAATSDEFLQILHALINNDPKQRLTVPQALVQMDKLYPEYVKKAVHAKQQRIIDDISRAAKQFTTLGNIISHSVEAIKISEDLVCNVNAIFKLQALRQAMLQLFEDGMTMDSFGIFNRIAAQIIALPDKPIECCVDQYFAIPENTHAQYSACNAEAAHPEAKRARCLAN